MTETAVPLDSAARVRAIAADGSVLVQAPAGSGKTTLLAQRYLRLLGRVDAPERILALTFTRRAAQEMRERVLRALCASGLSQCPPDIGHETWQLAVDASERMAARGLDLKSQPSRLRIETIDAFNAWLANQLPVTAGIGAALKILTDARPAYEEAARRALAHAGGDVFAGPVERVLELDDQRWGKLVKLIADMLPARGRWLPLLAGRLRAGSLLDEAQLENVRRHFDEDLRLLITRTILTARELLGAERLAALAPLLSAAARRLSSPSRLETWLADAGPLRTDAADVARWRCMAAALLTAGGKLRKSINVGDGFPPGCAEKLPMQELLIEFAREPRPLAVLRELRTLPEPGYTPEQWTRVRDVSQVLVLAAAELDGVFREQGGVDFAAFSLAALRALGTSSAPTDLNLRLDYRLQHILVDEFQDTSGAQLDLLRQLTAGWQAGDGRSLFCVGDPMQSIYGFRQAEVRAFLELAEVGIGEVRFEVQRLSSNFRSAAPLVEWINSRFVRFMPRDDDRERGAIAFRPSTAARVAAAPDAVSLSLYASRGAEANAIADMIAAARAEQPHWRIAVLVRAKSHAREIAASLRARQIAFRAVQIEALQDRAVVRDIIALACALQHLGDRIAWLALLRAPWAGLELADLLQIGGGAACIWDAMHEDDRLRALSARGAAACRRLSMTLQAAFTVRNDSSFARWIERTWFSLGGPACAASDGALRLASAAFARLQSLEQQGLPDVAELPQRFADLFADEGESGNVEIMTIHKAKGLEFDMIVLPALERGVPRDRDQLLLAHQFSRAGRDGMIMAARPPVGIENDRLFGFLRWQLRDATALEAQRLLYVACTRAKARLRLSGVSENAKSAAMQSPSAPLKRPRSGSLLAVLWPVAANEFVVHPAAQAASPPVILHGGPLRRLPMDFAPRGAATALRTVPATALAVASALPLQRQETPAFDWAGETARRVGSLVHAELQALHIRDLDERKVRSRSAHYKRWLGMHGVPADLLEQASARVVDALLGVHQDPRGRWILTSGYGDDLREHAISGAWAGEVTRAVFDRSFVDSGVRWVIDYKTSYHQGGGSEVFLDREVQRYRPQLQRYASLARRLGPEPVRLGLYFPLMRAWREWGAED